MPKNTDNLGLYQINPATDGALTFNIDTMLNENWDKIDEFAHRVEQGAISIYVHAKIGIIHNLAGSGSNLKFKATADFSAGDTFTVNGIAVTAKTINGASLVAGDFKSGNWVEAVLDGSALTVQFRSYAGETATDQDISNAVNPVANALNTHTGNGAIHITADERTAWNAKETPAGAQAKADAAKAAAIAAIPGSLPANGGSADYANTAGTANYANSAGSAPANGGNANYANSSGASNSCNGLTFSVEASPPGGVTNNRVTFCYG